MEYRGERAGSMKTRCAEVTVHQDKRWV